MRLAVPAPVWAWLRNHNSWELNEHGAVLNVFGIPMIRDWVHGVEL